MREAQEEPLRRAQKTGVGSQPLVVRHTDKDFQSEVIEALSRLEKVIHPPPEATRVSGATSHFAGLEFKSITAVGAIVLSVAGYVIQDARNSSRQDADIEATKVRVATVEKIAATNTEARIRLEVELGELRDGQMEIKRLLVAHENETREGLQRK